MPHKLKKVKTIALFCLILYSTACYGQIDDIKSNKAKHVRIDDAGGYYTGTQVEAALQEIGAGTGGPSGVYYKLDGTNTNGYFYLDSTKYLKRIDGSTVGMYVNGELIMSWQNAPEGGAYMGFGAFTYPT